ncbi:AfsR/SARP family transcriptional regulator [Ellagibacter isourolithinifaciens]|uniref:AfsR/SARP family transcriptional regulator n=1 Tax=Ellagibacter isourolithinifaciens TaxID=2137581 RepID=UPI003AEF9C9B
MHCGDAARSRPASRACAVVRSFATKPACASWLAAHGADLLSAACFKPAHELFVYAGKNARQNRILLAADEAVRLAALDDAACALFLARKFASSRSIDPESRSRMLLVASCLGDDEDRRRAESVAAEFAARAKVGGSIAPAAAFSLVAAQVGKGVMPLAEAWGELASRGAPDGPLVFAAAMVFWALAQKKTPGFASPEDARAVERVALWACDLAARTPSVAMSWQCAFLVVSLSRAVEEGSLPTRFSPAADALAAARAIEAARFTECAAHRRDSLREERARAERERSSRDRYEARPIRSETPGAPGSSAPILYVRLLGGLDVRIGEQQVDMQAFSRQKTKTLLALLVLARGRELSRERLLETLWPDSPHGCAIKNFYSVWSQLKRGLDYEGTCPYLLRDQGGVRLDARLLRSDVAELDSICRALSFGEIDLDRWRDHLEAIDGSYSGDLLPSESVNDDIAAARRRLRINLVDSLVCASGRLLESGEPRAALWFAREAAGRDRSREDACAALMEAQLGAGQRAAAIDTYLSCRRYLVEELGIDPSPSIVALYRSAVEAEEALE